MGTIKQNNSGKSGRPTSTSKYNEPAGRNQAQRSSLSNKQSTSPYKKPISNAANARQSNTRQTKRTQQNNTMPPKKTQQGNNASTKRPQRKSAGSRPVNSQMTKNSLDYRRNEKNIKPSNNVPSNKDKRQNTKPNNGSNVHTKKKSTNEAVRQKNAMSAHRPKKSNAEVFTPKKYTPMPPKKRKRRKVMVYLSILFAVLTVGIVLSLTVLFKIEIITVSGETRYSNNDIIAACGIAKGENLFLINKKSACDNIDSKFPYIEAVEIDRKIPSTVNIHVTEGIPVVMIHENDQYYIISSNNRVLEVDTKCNYELPLLKGVQLSKKTLGMSIEFEEDNVRQIVETMMNSIINNSVNKVIEIDLTDLAAITLNYDNRISVRLGSPENIDYKIRTAAVIIADELEANDSGVLDVSLSKSYF